MFFRGSPSAQISLCFPKSVNKYESLFSVLYATSLPPELPLRSMLPEAGVFCIGALYMRCDENCNPGITEGAIKVADTGFLTFQVPVQIAAYYSPYEKILKYVFAFFFFRVCRLFFSI